MLKEPKLASCSNRELSAKVNPKYGEPTSWFSNEILKDYDYSGLSFDFFVNWEKSFESSNVVWYKLIIEDFHNFNANSLSDEVIRFLGKDILKTYIQFLNQYNLILKFIIIPDNQDFSLDDAVVYFIEYNPDLEHTLSIVNLEQLKNIIISKSGGPVKMGRKGLIYGTSRLECMLSKTKSLYPGDIDMIVFNNKTKHAKLIFEFKKHNLSTELKKQTLSNYYPVPDKRKYDRIGIFRNIFFPNIPVIIIYYSTDPKCDYILAEYIDEQNNTLASIKKATISFDRLLTTNIIDPLINWIRP